MVHYYISMLDLKFDLYVFRTLKVVKPFLSAKEFESFKEAMKEFQSNEGPALQKILQQRLVNHLFLVNQG